MTPLGDTGSRWSFFPAGRTAGGIASRLPYPRSQLPAGAPLGIPAHPALDPGSQVVRLGFSFGTHSLGDQLLRLGALRAAVDALRLSAPQRTVLVPRDGLPLLSHAGIDVALEPLTGRVPDLLLTDTSCCRHPHELLIPEPPAREDADGARHAALPDRYYLAVEEASGRRLPLNAPTCPTLEARDDRLLEVIARRVGTGPYLVFVTATSLPDRKDYGRPRYIAALESLALATPGLAGAALVEVAGTELPTVRDRLVNGRRLIELRGQPASQLLAVFARAALVLGNDTGLTHLAAMARHSGRAAQVLGLYSRHSHAKWRTGLPNHHALASPVSQLMDAHDLCPVRLELDERRFGPANDFSALPPRQVARWCQTIVAATFSRQ